MDGRDDGREDGLSENTLLGVVDGDAVSFSDGDEVAAHRPHVITQTSHAFLTPPNEKSLSHISFCFAASFFAMNLHVFSTTPTISPFSFLYSCAYVSSSSSIQVTVGTDVGTIDGSSLGSIEGTTDGVSEGCCEG